MVFDDDNNNCGWIEFVDERCVEFEGVLSLGFDKGSLDIKGYKVGDECVGGEGLGMTWEEGGNRYAERGGFF